MQAFLALALVFSFCVTGFGEDKRRDPMVKAIQKTQKSILPVAPESRLDELRPWIGTLFVVDERGIALSAAHVFKKEEKYVTRIGGVLHKLEIMARDEDQDIALIRIRTKENIPAISLGPSSDALVGEQVAVIGSPFAYDNSVARGSIAAVDRDVFPRDCKPILGAIQLDAFVFPGHSGGPVINTLGEAVGMVLAAREANNAMGFAIPSDKLEAFLVGKSGAKTFGIDIGFMVEKKILAEDGDSRVEISVASIGLDSDAHRGGLKLGDRILKVGAFPTKNLFDFERGWIHLKEGESVPVVIERDGHSLTQKIAVKKLTALP